jgi:hypothetical protein
MDFVKPIYWKSLVRFEGDAYPTAVVVTEERNGYIVWDKSLDLEEGQSWFEAKFVRFVSDRERALEFAVDLAREKLEEYAAVKAAIAEAKARQSAD